eukprot:3082521-Amphidinium_carterae.1
MQWPLWLGLRFLQPTTKILECAEGGTLWIPGGVGSVQLAWYGEAKRPWQCDAGTEVTSSLQEAISSNNTVLVTKASFGDPCPRLRKKLLVLVDANSAGVDLFCPGLVVSIYRRNGSLHAAEVACDMPSLRRILVDKRMIEDHRSMSYHRALQT